MKKVTNDDIGWTGGGVLNGDVIFEWPLSKIDTFSNP